MKNGFLTTHERYSMKSLIIILTIALIPAIASGEPTVKDWSEWHDTLRLQYLTGVSQTLATQLSVCTNKGNPLANPLHQGIPEKEALQRFHKHLLWLVENRSDIDYDFNLSAAVLLTLSTPIHGSD